MARFTKKYMTEDYERLYDHGGLLELYLYDTQAGHKPDAVETEGKGTDKVRLQLWRATSASGGYVVMQNTIASIWTLDEANRIFHDRHDEHSLAIRLCLERLTIARNKAWQLEDCEHGVIKASCPTCR